MDGRDGSSGGDLLLGEWKGSCPAGTRLSRQSGEYPEDCCISDSCYDEQGNYSQDTCESAGIAITPCWQSPCEGYSCDDGFEVQEIGGPLDCIHNQGAFVEGVFRTTDGGRSWHPFNQGFSNLPPDSPLNEYPGGPTGYHHLVADPYNPGRIYLGTPEGLFAAQEDGSTWEKLTSDHIEVLKVDPSSGRIRVVSYERDREPEYHYHWSDDAGETWSSRGIDVSGFFSIGVNDLIASPSRPGHLLIGVVATGMGLSANLFRSTDNGGSWSEASTPGADTGSWRVWRLAISTAPGERVYAATGNHKLFRTDDFGTNWEEVPEPPGGRCLPFLARDPCAPGQILCGTGYEAEMWIFNEQDGQWAEHPDLRRYWSNGLQYSADCESAYAYRLRGRVGKTGFYSMYPDGTIRPESDFGFPDCGGQIEFAREDVGNLVQASHQGSPWKPAVKGLPVLRGIDCLSVRMHSFTVSRNNPLIAFAFFALSQDCIYD